jgi:hypothetical protein
MAGQSLILSSRMLSTQAGCHCLPWSLVISLMTVQSPSTRTRLLLSRVVQGKCLLLRLFRRLGITETMIWIEELGNTPRPAHHPV